MSQNQTPNYAEQGGARSVIGAAGELDIIGTLKKNGVDLTEQLTFTYAARHTLIELNAGITICAAIAGKKYKVTHYYFRVIGGAATAATDVRLQDSNSSPVVVVTMAVAGLAEDDEIDSDDTIANITKGAGWMTALTAAKSLDVVKTGSAMTTMTHLDVIVEYQIVA